MCSVSITATATSLSAILFDQAWPKRHPRGYTVKTQLAVLGI